MYFTIQSDVINQGTKRGFTAKEQQPKRDFYYK